MFLNNPEFKKNFKLEVSTTRIVACAIILLLVGYAAYAGTTTKYLGNALSVEAKQAMSVYGAFCTVGFLFSIIWGSYLASNSITAELQQRTWTFLCMSPLSPSRILFGKVFGGTALVWIITLSIILPVFIITLLVGIPGSGFIRPETVTISVFIATLILWTVSSHAAAILLALQNHLSLNESDDKRNNIAYTLIVLLAGIFIGQLVIFALNGFHAVRKYNVAHSSSMRIDPGTIIEPGKYLKPPGQLEWYGFEFFSLDMILIIMAFATFWLIVATYRSLRKALHFHDSPWVWPLFLMAATILLFGFEYTDTKSFKMPLASSGLLIIGLAILLSCLEAGDTIRYQSWAMKIRQGKISESFRAMPLWVISAIAFLILIPISVSLSKAPTAIAVVACSALLYAIKDILVIHILSWSKAIKRPKLAILVYALIVYGLVPWIAGKESDLFLPVFSRHLIMRPEGIDTLYWIIILTQIAIAAGLCLRQWKKVAK